MNIHGGQDIDIKINLIDDFSVTTNFMGLSEIGKNNIINNLEKIKHYPNQYQEPYKSNLISWLYQGFEANKNIVLGNGASELIDLLIKIFRYDKKYCIYNSKKWKPGSSTVQYIEYGRTCENYDYIKASIEDLDSDITCIINPCNPTGEYLSVDKLKLYIENSRNNSLVIVDESMQPWLGKDFREDSLISQTEWIKNILEKRNIYIFVIHSWTKFFCCTGIRIGSLICPNEELKNLILKYQIPWSCNILALKYLDGCIIDKDYIEKTWLLTPILRNQLVNKIKSIYPLWKIYGREFLSWLWIDTKSTFFAKLIYDMCKLNGVPIRLGINGYNLPSFIRIGVRSEKSNNIILDLLENLKTYNENKYSQFKIPEKLVIKFDTIDIQTILPHEEIITERFNKLLQYINSLENTKIIPAIIVDYKTNILIDGHHRLEVFKVLNINKIPVIYIDYLHPNIIINPNNKISRDDVINSVNNNILLPPKSTQHMIIDEDDNLFPIILISSLVYINEKN